MLHFPLLGLLPPSLSLFVKNFCFMFLSNTEANASLLLPSYSNDSYNDISLFSRWPFLVLQSTRRRVRASRLSLHQLLLMKGETVVFRVPFFLVPVVLPIPSRNEPSKGIYIISHAGYIGFDSDPNRNTSARILLPRKHFFSFLSYNLSAQRCSNLFSSLSLSTPKCSDPFFPIACLVYYQSSNKIVRHAYDMLFR